MNRLFVVTILCLHWAVAAAGAGASKDAVGLSKISLPSGPGSVEGLGEAFEPQLNSGTATYRVKIALPPGVNALQPDVALSYDGGSGNGPFGLAWNWAPMSIQRQTEKGLPNYGASDVFTFLGEELVRLDDGSYRVENEGGFHHIRREGEGWLVRDRRGARYRLGLSANARIARPDGVGFGDTFKWLVEEVEDTHGNRMTYGYVTFPDSPGQRYCGEIRYSIHRTEPGIYHSVEFQFEPRRDVLSSCLSGFEIRTGRRCRGIEVRSQGGLVRRYQLDYDLPTGDPIEPVSLADAGLDFSLIRRITQFDRTEPGLANSRTNYLPPLQFAYTRFDVTSGERGRVVGNPRYSLSNPNLAFADINGDSLPDLLYTDPLTGGHSVFYNLGHGRFGPETPFVFAPWNLTLDVPETQLADFDGDGRVDLVQKHGLENDRFVYYPNTTRAVDNDEARPAWGPEQSFEPPFPPFMLDDPGVRSLDLDGDKRMDYLRTTAAGLVYFFNRAPRWEQDGLLLWGDPRLGDLSRADGIQFDEIDSDGVARPNRLVQLADFNGDRLLDLAKLTYAGDRLEITWWPNQGRGAWGRREIMAGSLDVTGLPLEDIFIEDLNGDGLADVVAVDHQELRFWINQGNGRFSAEFRRGGMPEYRRGETVLRQADLNGNGSTDFVWENFDALTGEYVIEYYDFLGAGRPNLLRTIDNGIGLRTHIAYRTTTDYAVAARESGRPWHTRLPFPSTVVSRITQEFGLDLDAVPGADEYLTEFSYFDGYYDGFEKEFRGFRFVKKIERGDDRFPGAEVNSPSTLTRFAFHTGTPDGLDNNGDGATDEFNPQGGYEEEPLKGKLLWQEVTLPTADFGGHYPAQVDGLPADDSVVFTRERQEWRIKTIHGPTHGFDYVDALGAAHPEWSIPSRTTDGKRVSLAFLARSTKELIEANGALAGADPLVPVRPRRVLRVDTEVDFYGNPIVTRNHGEDSPGSSYDDEKFIWATFAFDLEGWLIGLPALSRVTDEHGVFASETRRYYADASGMPLPLGAAGLLGDLVREERSINGAARPPAFSVISNAAGDPRREPDAFLVTTRTRYDRFGNVIEVRDPRYTDGTTGHSREFAYDSLFQTYIERETIHVGGGRPDLVASAEYDSGAGVMTSSTDFNGNSTRYQYDSFWRLVGIVKPGDTEAFPTQTFHYRPGDLFRGLYYDYDAAGNLTLIASTDTVVSSVTTRAREQAGASGTFDTIAFTDGVGHQLGVAVEGETPGQWVFKDVKRYTSRGLERDAFLPFFHPSTGYVVPPAGLGRVTKFYDAAGREIRSVNPPETADAGARVTTSRTVYLPLETVLHDEEDLEPASPHFGTPHVQYHDGLGRLIGVDEVVRLTDDGTPLPSDGRGAGGEGIVNWPTRYEYDLNDQLTHITDSQGNEKWFRYDGLGRKLFMNDPDRGVMTYTYDDASNLRETLDAKDQRITYTYDGVNRLLTEKYHDGLPPPPWRSSSPLPEGGGQGEGVSPSVIYHYDTPDPNLPQGDNTTATGGNTKGMLAWIEDLSGEEHTSYDTRGRIEWMVKRIPDPEFLSRLTPHVSLVSYRTAFAYDSLDRVTTLTYPDNDEVSHLYSPRNLLVRITGGPSGSILSNLLYRASDQLQQIDYGNGVRTTYDYDPRLRLASLFTHHVSRLTEPLIHFRYDFDGASNIRRITDARPAAAVPAGDPRRNTQIFDYDDLYRITRAQYSFETPGQPVRDDGVIAYRYDRIGNMLAQTSTLEHNEKGLPVANLGEMDSGGPAGRFNRKGRIANDPPGPHALTSIRSSLFPLRSFPYDSNGNMLVIDGLTNTWDFKDRLVAVESAEMRADYTYDYTDRRILKRVHYKPGVTNHAPRLTTVYVNKYFEVREHDAPVKYVWNGETRVARVTGSLDTDQRVQRLRLWPGWNLVSLAVSGSPLPLGEGSGVRAAFRWNQPTLTWLPVSTKETLPAGTVLWLHAETNATLAATGTYSDPVNQTLQPGVNFVSGWGLQPLKLSDALPASTVAWKYDAVGRHWSQQLTDELLAFSDLPPMLTPGDALLARLEAIGTLTVPESALTVRYYHQDHLGSSSVLTDAAGELVIETANYAFGFTRNEFQPHDLHEPYRFTGKEKDGESGLSNYERRFLSHSLSRFLCTDPLRAFESQNCVGLPQRFNNYALCINNPLTYSDPYGTVEKNVIEFQGKSLEGTVQLEFGTDYFKGLIDTGKDSKIFGGIVGKYESGGARTGCFVVGGEAAAKETSYQKSMEFCYGSSGFSFAIKTKERIGNAQGTFDASTKGAAGDIGGRMKGELGKYKIQGELRALPTFTNNKAGESILTLQIKGNVSVTIPTATPGLSVKVQLQGSGTATVNVSEVLKQMTPPTPAELAGSLDRNVTDALMKGRMP